MPHGTHSDARSEVEKLNAIVREQSHTITALEVNRRSGKCTIEGG